MDHDCGVGGTGFRGSFRMANGRERRRGHMLTRNPDSLARQAVEARGLHRLAPSAVQSVNAMAQLFAALPGALPGAGAYALHSLLRHRGEDDAGDNLDSYHADYCRI